MELEDQIQKWFPKPWLTQRVYVLMNCSIINSSIINFTVPWNIVYFLFGLTQTQWINFDIREVLWNAPKSIWKIYFSRDGICIFLNVPFHFRFLFRFTDLTSVLKILDGITWFSTLLTIISIRLTKKSDKPGIHGLRRFLEISILE